MFAMAWVRRNYDRIQTQTNFFSAAALRIAQSRGPDELPWNAVRDRCGKKAGAAAPALASKLLK
jgi:hypothetical protein